jgi:hypothetical protein
MALTNQFRRMFSDDRRAAEIARANAGLPQVDDLVGMFSDDIRAVRVAHANNRTEVPEPDPSDVRTHSGFTRELAQLINKYSLENGSNTPDYVLATYLTNCLFEFNEATNARRDHFKR